MSINAVVKSVISGDTLVLRDPASGKESLLHLADIAAPRLGNQSRDDEPWAFEAREFLRRNVVGKPVVANVVHSLPAGNDNTPRDIGSASIDGRDVAIELLRTGWAQLKELKREPTEADTKKRDVEAEAKTAGKGIWNPHGPKARTVHYQMPADSHAFITEWKGKEIDGIVEQVREGSNLRIRLLLPEGDHQFVNLSLAGVKTPRIANRAEETSEPYADDSRLFTESKLLQRSVGVTLLSLPMSTATPFQSASSAPAPAAVSNFIGTVNHPAGNIAEHLVASGLATISGWQAGMLSANGAFDRLRNAERTAREKKLRLFNLQAGAAASGTATPKATPTGPVTAKNFDAIITRVWSGDQVSLVERDKEAVRERRVQLSSVRAPRQNDPKQAHYAHEAREFLRKRIVGRHVRVSVDFIRPKEGEFEEREAVTIKYGGQHANIAEQLIDRGLATAVRHRRDDDDRSPEYDKLVAAEQAAAAEQRGVHSGKEHPAPKPPLNISESNHRATPFLSGLKRQGKIPAVVDYVAAGSRFKILLPKENHVLTFVLAGVRAPRSARPGEKGEPYGQEALDFATRRYMQRDVEVEFYDVDKSGGFIGGLYLPNPANNKEKENVAIVLVKEGLAQVHERSAEGLSWYKAVVDAEQEAKDAKRKLWAEYNEESVVEEKEDVEGGPLQTSYQDVIVSDVRPRPDGLVFSIQILNTEGIASLETLMREFSLYHKTAASPAGWTPKPGELVSAKFSDGAWYRAKVRRSSAPKKEAEVVFIDYGNESTVGFSDVRPLDARFKGLAGQAHEARLSFVKLADPESEYHSDAIDRFRQLCDGRKLVANTDFREGGNGVRHLRLMDPTYHLEDPLASINVDLLREGWATIDKKGCARYLGSYPQVMKRMKEVTTQAKKERLGVFEYGDVEEDD